jgi:hypothetical protein
VRECLFWLQNLTPPKGGVILRSGVPGIFVIQGVIAKSKKHRYSAAFANSGARTGSLTNAGWQKASSSFEADALITDMAPAISDQTSFSRSFPPPSLPCCDRTLLIAISLLVIASNTL